MMQEPWKRTQSELDAEALAKAAWLARRAADEAALTKKIKPRSTDGGKVIAGGVDLLDAFRARVSELPSAPAAERTKRRLPNEGWEAPCWQEGALDAVGTLAMSDPPRFVQVKLCFEGVRKSISVPVGATTDELFDAAADLHGLHDHTLELSWSSGVPVRRGVYVSTTRLAYAAKGEDVFVRKLQLPRRPRSTAPRALEKLAKGLGYRLLPLSGGDEGAMRSSFEVARSGRREGRGGASRVERAPREGAQLAKQDVEAAPPISAAAAAAAVAAPVSAEVSPAATSVEDAAKAAWLARQGMPSWGPRAAGTVLSEQGPASRSSTPRAASVAAGGGSQSDEITLAATRAVERAAEAAKVAAEAAQSAADAARIAAEAAQMALAARAPT